MKNQNDENDSQIWSSFIESILTKPVYWFCILFITCLSYFFDLMNRTVGMDDMTRPYYVGKGMDMLAATRWGKTFWINLLANDEYIPFIDKFLSIIFLIIGAVCFSKILYDYFIITKYSLVFCTLFSCLFISFPLINEIWNYNDSNIVMACNMVLVGISILFLRCKKGIFSNTSLICSVILSLAVSSYESSFFLYITVVLSLLLLDYIIHDRKNWLLTGIRYTIPLFLSVILRYVIGFLIILVLRLKYEPNGETGILWNLKENLIPQVFRVIERTLDQYFVRGLIYYPITVFVVAFLSGTVCIMIISIKRKDIIIFLIYSFLCCSLFFQSVIQGAVMPYRTAQTIHYFSSMSLTILLFLLVHCNKRKLSYITFVFICLLCYRQGVFLNKTFSLNNLRSDNEAAIVHNIGYRLKSMYEDKTVIFVGVLDIGDHIDRQIHPSTSTIGGRIYRKIAVKLGWGNYFRRLYETDVSSVLIWSTGAYLSQILMKELFSYYGYDISVRNNNDIYEYKQLAIQEGMKPLEIRDFDDFLLVYLGD